MTSPFVAAYATGMLFPHLGKLLFPGRRRDLPVCRHDTPLLESSVPDMRIGIMKNISWHHMTSFADGMLT